MQNTEFHLTLTGVDDVSWRSYWLFKPTSNRLLTFFSSKLFFPGVWHFQSTPGVFWQPQSTAATGGKVKPANRNVTQSFLSAFLSLAFPTTYNEKFFLPKYCLNFKYTMFKYVSNMHILYTYNIWTYTTKFLFIWNSHLTRCPVVYLKLFHMVNEKSSVGSWAEGLQRKIEF